MSQIKMIIVGAGVAADATALQAAGVRSVGFADNFHQSPAAVSRTLTAWRRSAQLVVVDQEHATSEILAMIDWPAVVVLDSPSAQAIYAARRLGLNFVVSNPLLHSVSADGWGKIAERVGGPRSAAIEYYSLDGGRDLVLSRGLLGQLVGVACELLGLPSVDGALSLPPGGHSVDASVLFTTHQLLYVVAQKIRGPRIAITLNGPEGHVEVRLSADEVDAPRPPAFWSVRGDRISSGEHVDVPLSSYAVARDAQARYIAGIVEGRHAPLHTSDALLGLAEVFDAAMAASTLTTGYVRFERRPW